MPNITFRKNGVRRNVKVGFSWTVLFFGPLAFMARGMWGMVAISWIAAMLTLGISVFIIPFYANKWYGRWLAENGWETLEPTPARWGIGA